MTREPTLLYGQPSHVASAQVKIEHGQLRDLITCPQDRGVVNYVAQKAIMEHDVTNHSVAPRRIAKLKFEANTIASYALPNTDEHLLAAGGQHGELYLALHAKQSHVPWRTPSSSSSADARSTPSYRPRYTTRRVWGFEHTFAPTINNSVIFTPTYIAPSSGPSSSEPRMVISNNKETVTFYDIAVRVSEGDEETSDRRPVERIQPCGSLSLDVPVNHSSVSPDGQTLLSVGDSAQVHLHHISPGSHLTFTRAMTLTVPKPSDLAPALSIPPSSYPASFSTAFSASGSKFAVGAQNGVVAVWDVRSSKPLRTFRTDRPPPEYNEAGFRSGGASGWLRYSNEWESHMSWPSGGVRCLKFGGGGDGQGREVMAFTEHTGRIHIVDATTFDTEELIHMPAPRFPPALPSSNPRSRSASPPRNSFDFLHSAERDIASTHHAPLRYVHMRSWEPLLLRQNAQIPEFNPGRIGGMSPFRPASSGVDEGGSEHGSGDAEGDENHAPGGGEEGEHSAAHDEILIPALENAIAEEDVRQLLVWAQPASISTTPAPQPTESSYPSGSLARIASRLSQPQPPGFRRLNLRPPSPSASVGSSTLATEDEGDRGRWRKDRYEWDDDVDLAGLCFDASGSRMYVASIRAVAEWEVKGSEKRWWTAGTWA